MRKHVIFDYDECPVLSVDEGSIEWLTEKLFFKTRILKNVEKIEGNTVFFRKDTTYLDIQKIDGLFRARFPMSGYEYSATDNVLNFIDQRNLYIEKRASLGTELKTDAIRLDNRYRSFKSVVESRMVRNLREKQMRDAFFMLAMTKSGNFSVPGSGKTTSALAVYTYLKSIGLVDRIVMIGPKNAFGSWIDEFQACFGEKEKLVCFNVQNPELKTAKERRFTLKYESTECNLFLFNYESIGSCLNEISDIVATKSLLVFDEVHKVKAVKGQRATAALEIAQNASYTIAMTGTPIPNSYLDLYNLLHILYHDEYREFFGFGIPFLKNPDPTEIEYINSKIQPFFCRTTKKELSVPDANPDVILQVKATEDEQRIFEILQQKYRNNNLALFIRLLQAESNPRMLLEKLDFSEFSSILNISENIDEIDFVDYSDEIRQLILSAGIASKKNACISQIKSLVSEGKKVVVWCIFRDSIHSIHNLLENLGISSRFIMGEVELEDRLQFIRDFKDGQYDVLVTNPHTLAESVSLHTVCHDAVYFEYSYDLVHLLQSKDRIHRLGLPEGQYTQYHFLQSWFEFEKSAFSMDEKVYLRLQEKEQTMLDAIDNQILEKTYTPEEDLAIIFNQLIP